MAIRTNRQIQLAARPIGLPKVSDFKLVEVPVSSPGIGQILTRTIYLSLDPYMRGRMSAGRSYAKPVEVGEVMTGGTVSQVIESNLGEYTPGDFVLGINGWQEYALSDGANTTKLDPRQAPISTAVGVLGMPGMSAHLGLLEIGKPKPGETVVVSAASGAVGAVVGQIAKIKGCRVVGIAGATKKCEYVTTELGFDACVSHLDDNFTKELKAMCPNGVDIYFDNVGGKVLDAVFPLLNDYARVPVCGGIANFNMTELPVGPNLVPRLMARILVRRLTLRGFIVFDHDDRREGFLKDVGGWVRSGQLKYKEHITDGLENAVSAFQGLFSGENFGKLLVKVSDDPTRS